MASLSSARRALGRRFARVGMSALFSLASSTTIIAFALLSAAAVSWLSIRDARENLITQGALFTERFAGQATLALLYASPENAREPVRQALDFPQVQAVGIYDAQGQPLLETTPLGPLRVPAEPPPPDAGAVIERENAAQWVFLAPVYAGGSDAESSPFAPPVPPELLGYVRLAESKASLGAIARRVVWSNLAISAAIAIVLAALSHLLGQRIAGPIRALAAAMRRAQEGDTGARAAETGPLELRTMEAAFNRMMDVLEQREADLRSARDQAMEAARVKAQFAAHVSHELRTPLNGLLGMLQLLDSAGSEEQRRRYLRTALSSGRALLAVINDILDFSRGEAGKVEIEARTFALRARLEEMIDLLHPIAHAKGISLECRVAPDVPDGLVGDPTRIGQVLTNLIGNAIRFTSHGGVTVHVTRVSSPQERMARADLRFEVADTGIGIEPEAQAQIFESFTQASAATGQEYGGSGLGLTIARQLVELMGGEIGLSSTPGVGSTFWFTLSLPVAAAAAAGPLAGVQVLAALAAEHADARSLIQRLQRLGASVTTHASGAQLLLAAARVAPDSAPTAVLVGAQLGDMPGAELARYLARLPQHALIRSFALTASASPGAPPPGCEGWLRLAASEAELVAALAPRAARANAGARRARVLVAEDDAASQMVARGLLETAGCEVQCVNDGGAALEALAREYYDLVFLDINMPVLGGLATAQALRERGGELPPLIAMTANTLPEDVARARAAGMDDFIGKPVQLEAVNAILDRWLRAPSAAEAPERGAGTAGPLMDANVLAQLRAALGARVDDIVATFLADAQALLAEIETHASLTAPGHVRELAHRLKGAARNVGAAQLAAAAEHIERAARAGAQGLPASLLEQLRTALAQTRAHLEAQGHAGPAAGAGPAAAVRPTVLVVEDDRSTRMTLRALLEDDGYAVLEAGDGREALALVERRRPDLVLMDAMLPVQDGFSACREINQRPPAERVPVLMITSLDDEVSVERAFRAGAVDFVPKPINLGVLRRRVHRLVSAQASERDARRLAYHDTLTGLVNRSAFGERADRVLRAGGESAPGAVLYLDLDRFKRVNDTLGHDGGDELLRQAARRLADALPQGAALARMGSDEFAAAFPVRGAQDAGQIAERIVRALAGPVRIGGHDVQVSASAGVALYPADAQEVDSLVKFAETAATRAKEQGGNAVHFYRAGMSAALRERVELEADLRKAIERGELVLFYQPQLELAQNRVTGVEALVRWRHPRRGLVPPGEFIGLAEEVGLIGALGEWVLREACAQAQRWRRAGVAPLRIGVNVSARQLAAPEFVDLVAHALRETGLPANALELEVTESVLVQDREGTRQLLSGLRALGVRVAIDDFGTGYSSLGYLKHLPVDTLKIDRTFVSGLPMDPHDVAITTGVLNLARSLGIEVVAEGVETGAQLRFLREYGCTFAQGFLLQAPLPAAAFESWLASRPGQRRRGA